jgi:DNA-directed RNA polymerase specialized sigma24 family protein
VQSEYKAQIQALLDTLSPDYRTVVVLHYWYDLSYEEIAQTTDSTISAVKSRLFRARRMLAKQLQTDDGQASSPSGAFQRAPERERRAGEGVRKMNLALQR